jgi:hypothetical protein
VGGSLPLPEDDWLEPPLRPDDSVPADFLADSLVGWREPQGRVAQAAPRPRSPEDVP